MKSPGNVYIYVHPTSKGVKRFPHRLKSVFQEGISIVSRRTIFQNSIPSRKIIKYSFPQFSIWKITNNKSLQTTKKWDYFQTTKRKNSPSPTHTTWRMGSQDLEDPWFNGGPLVDPFWTSPFPDWGVYGTPSFYGSPSEGSSRPASVPSKPHGKPWSLSHASSAPTTWTGRNGWWVDVR